MRPLLAAFVAAFLLLGAGAARADYAFSGSGGSGTLVGPDEAWTFDADQGESSFTLNDFGSPGVSYGYANYDEALPAYGFVISFSGGGTIDPNSIITGNNSDCSGNSGGGTTFCTGSNDIWYAFSTGPSSIDFLAQNDTFNETTSAPYFVNIFFDGATPTSFTGAWLTRYTPDPSEVGSGGAPTQVPEPGTLALLIPALAALALGRRWLRP